MTQINTDYLQKGISYAAYREMIDKLMAEGKTTGADHSEAMLHHTQMNITRMNRWDKTTHIQPEIAEKIQAITQKQTWLILTEAWCGDAAQNIPVIEHIAALNAHIETKYLLRDENLELMDAFLTNGGRAIPKLICVAENGEVLWHWGPRPAAAQQTVLDAKAAGLPKEQMMEQVHLWYARNKAEALQNEILAKLESLVLSAE